jgi:hypothetical protein
VHLVGSYAKICGGRLLQQHQSRGQQAGSLLHGGHEDATRRPPTTHERPSFHHWPNIKIYDPNHDLKEFTREQIWGEDPIHPRREVLSKMAVSISTWWRAWRGTARTPKRERRPGMLLDKTGARVAKEAGGQDPGGEEEVVEKATIHTFIPMMVAATIHPAIREEAGSGRGGHYGNGARPY